MNRSDKAAAAVVLGIGAGAFALSYEALYAVSVGAGVNAKLGHVYPLIVEGFVTVATWVAYRLRDWGWKATAYPWILSAVFFAFSVWANSLPDTVPAPIVRGVPSIALGFAAHLFAHMTKKRVVELVAVEPVELVELPEEELLPADPWEEWTLPLPEAEPKKIAVSASVSAADGDGSLIRSWAKSRGFNVKDTGRIPVSILEAFTKAHGGSLVKP
ncbi:DUF2637 domain-containing protein [Streptomyces sp. NBC_01751]|uniref:DUF2637 domain-containing protein n=1 Tax=Streptomyces sp. NBC_01751 TaxID=2975929 RepID=UPI002DD833E7|nr:DUF2637 domain-containing protein [Streptomyces sp. NBC_01751]WSD23366.1 DUF2637 domain-containing protein [Streptomyces sp. NBC_01751]